jgi:hypothetical protein
MTFSPFEACRRNPAKKLLLPMGMLSITFSLGKQSLTDAV